MKKVPKTLLGTFFHFWHQKRNYSNRVPIHHAIAATKADAGMVRNHAQTIFPATPQRTADILWEDPTPTMAPVIV